MTDGWVYALDTDGTARPDRADWPMRGFDARNTGVFDPVLWLRGDLNCDGAFNGADIDPCFLVLGDTAEYYRRFPNCNHMLADMNRDGWVNGADIDPFFECLGGGCP